jgi:hypothetical protein
VVPFLEMEYDWPKAEADLRAAGKSDDEISKFQVLFNEVGVAGSPGYPRVTLVAWWPGWPRGGLLCGSIVGATGGWEIWPRRGC